MSTVSVWTPAFSAAAALVGGGLGAMLQGRYGITSWRRQTRLEAYTRFISQLHDFTDCLTEALDVFGEAEFSGKWSNVYRAQRQIGRAGSLVVIAGPQSVQDACGTVGRKSLSIRNGVSSGIVSEMARARKMDQVSNEYAEWIQSCADFQRACRIVLKTQK